MKVLFFLICNICSIAISFSQNEGLIGTWDVYKCLLQNGEDGSKYTFDNKALKSEMKLKVWIDSNKVELFDGDNLIIGVYSINADTLTIEQTSQFSHNLIRKYLIKSLSPPMLILNEIKPRLDTNYLIKSYYFKKSLNQSILPGNKAILEISEKAPVFVGGEGALHSFLKKNIVYPKKLRKTGIKGKVFVKLTIDEKGNVSNAEYIGNPRLEFAEEAMRVCRMMPIWHPGIQNNIPVSTYYNLPISFE